MIIVKYLAACSIAELPHIVWDVFTMDLQAGCTLTAVKIKSFLEDLGLKHWVFNEQTHYKVPHGWNPTRSLSGNPYPGPSMSDQSVQVESIRAKCSFEPIPGP